MFTDTQALLNTGLFLPHRFYPALIAIYCPTNCYGSSTSMTGISSVNSTRITTPLIRIFSLAVLFAVFLLYFPVQSEASESFDENKAKAVAVIEQLFEMFPKSDSETLQRDGKPVRIEVTGIKDNFARISINDDINRAMVTRDAEKLVDLFLEHYLQVNFENSTDEVLSLASKKFDTPEARLYKALMENKNEDALKIIETESPNLESLTEEGFSSFTPLAVAVRNNNIEIVEQLIDRGADPNNKPKEMLFHPMDLAVINGYMEMTLLLLDAGVDPNLRVGALNRDPLTLWAVRLDSMELMQTLVDKGADPSNNGVHGWTALGNALVQGNSQMIDFLVERSNPLAMTHSQRRAESVYDPHLARATDYPYFPAGNALFLAQTFGNAGIENLETRLYERVEEVNGEAGRIILELQAANSASQLAYAEHGALDAMTPLENALSAVEIASLDASASGDYVQLVMSMLADLHELKLINGEPFEDKYRALSTHITSMGGWRASVHDMLDVLQSATEGDAADSFEEWQSEHKVSSLGKWNFGRLNAWLETVFDKESANRLHEILDFYELPRFAVK